MTMGPHCSAGIFREIFSRRPSSFVPRSTPVTPRSWSVGILSSQSSAVALLPLHRTCAEHTAQSGVIIGVQNHGDFLPTADQLISLPPGPKNHFPRYCLNDLVTGDKFQRHPLCMKKTSSLLSVIALAIALAPLSAFAAKADGSKAKLIAKYDTNKNGKLDPDEIEALKKDFAADPKGELAKLDTNKDGKLSDDEIASLTGPAKKGAKKGNKKNAPAATPADPATSTITPTTPGGN
jgi:EF hand domain-containing protein